MQTASAVLLELFVLAIFLERAVQVLSDLFTVKIGLVIYAPGEPGWRRWQVWLVFVLACVILSGTEYDVIQKLMGKSVANLPWLGYLLGALVVAGGSAAIRKMIEAVGTHFRLIKRDAELRLKQLQ